MQIAMTFTFYHTKLCPRCARVRKHLKTLLGQAYASRCIEIDSMTQPLKTWQAGIRMIPALKSDHVVLSGVLLSKEQIRNFLIQQRFLDDRTES